MVRCLCQVNNFLTLHSQFVPRTYVKMQFVMKLNYCGVTQYKDFRLITWDVTEMVPYLIWGSDFFGPREIWSPKKNHYMALSCRPKTSLTSWIKLLGAQISQEPIKSGAQSEIGDHFGYCHYLAWRYVEMCAMYTRSPG